MQGEASSRQKRPTAGRNQMNFVSHSLLSYRPRPNRVNHAHELLAQRQHREKLGNARPDR